MKVITVEINLWSTGYWHAITSDFEVHRFPCYSKYADQTFNSFLQDMKLNYQFLAEEKYPNEEIKIEVECSDGFLLLMDLETIENPIDGCMNVSVLSQWEKLYLGLGSNKNT